MPPPKVDDQINPDYNRWLLQDQLIILAINSYLSTTVLSHVLECTTSRDVWNTLQNLYAAQSSTHIVQIQDQLATLKKGSESISDYYHKATSLAASLSAAGTSLVAHAKSMKAPISSGSSIRGRHPNSRGGRRGRGRGQPQNFSN